MNKIDFTSIFGQPVKINSELKTSLQMFFDKNIFEVEPGPGPSDLKTLINGLDQLMLMSMDKNYFDASQLNQELFTISVQGITNYAQYMSDPFKQTVIEEIGEDNYNDGGDSYYGNESALYARFMSGQTTLNMFEKLSGYDPKSGRIEEDITTGNDNINGGVSPKIATRSTKKSSDNAFNPMDIFGVKDGAKAFRLPPDSIVFPSIPSEIRDACEYLGISADNLVFNDYIDKGATISIEFLNLGNSNMKIDPTKNYMLDFYTTIVIPDMYITRFQDMADIFVNDRTGYYHINSDLGVAYVTLSVPYYTLLAALVSYWGSQHQGEDPTPEVYAELYQQAKEIASHYHLTNMEMSWDNTKMGVVNLLNEYNIRKTAYEASPDYVAIPTGFGDINYPYMLPMCVYNLASDNMMGVCLPYNTFIEFEKQIYDWDTEKTYFDPDYTFTDWLEGQVANIGLNPDTTFIFTSVDQLEQLLDTSSSSDPADPAAAYLIDTANTDTLINISKLSYNDRSADPYDYKKCFMIYAYNMVLPISNIHLPVDGDYRTIRYFSNAELIDQELGSAFISPIIEDIELPRMLMD